MAITRLGPNQSVNLASNVTGTLPVANGGTNLTSGFVNGGVQTPAFEAKMTGVSTAISDGTLTTLTVYNSEDLDTDNCFDVFRWKNSSSSKSPGCLTNSIARLLSPKINARFFVLYRKAFTQFRLFVEMHCPQSP